MLGARNLFHGVSVEDRERCYQSGCYSQWWLNLKHHSRSSRIADKAIPSSMPGIGTPMRPSIPPRAMTIGKATGKSQMAGVPS